ncbi:MAG: short-chain dehydrogenase [Gemmatimonadetes bacterium]|nr:MAG: short-chain dehydrogenase [Gemmatimonadota bacterium]
MASEQSGNDVALVTGSSRGIGAAIARRFAREGAKVVLHGRDTNALLAVVREIEQSGSTVAHVTGDVTIFAEIERMRAEVEEKFGPVDILVANAGGSFTQPGPLEELPEDGWRASIDGNLTATFLTIKSVLPGMKARKSGNIITLSSAAARRPYPQSPIPYAAAKAGIQILTRVLAAQAGPFGIRANCIAPESILTERNIERIPDAQKTSLLDMHPIKRLGTPDDVANAAVFLVSDQSGWITGVVLDLAGGSVMV